MRILCVFGRYNYGDPSRGEGYEYSHFIPALRRLGHEVLFLESWNRACYNDFAELNDKLLRVVESERPHLILSVLFTHEIWLETWRLLRKMGSVALVNWTTDDSWKYVQSSRLVAPVFHAITTTYPRIFNRYQRDGIRHVLLTQWAANAQNLQHPLKAKECEFEVSFVGTAHGKRREWIDRLRKQGIEVTCFGYGWPRGPVAAQDIPRIVRNSVISLNFANSAQALPFNFFQQPNQIKARTFEVPGAGGFLLTEWAEGLDRHYVLGREVVAFRTQDELADKIYYYLAHPAERDAIANAGYRRTCDDHTYDHRLSKVLEFSMQHCKAYQANCLLEGTLPTGKIDWGRFELAAQQHSPNPKLLLLRKALIMLCSLVWGRQRGPRAARRLVHELSWRLVGARTYSAAGWPGRMFYNER